jgi:dihydroorotate dehydrogenase (NAD+) catalytic subunit
VWAKLTPNTHNLRGIAEAAMGADAFVLINTVRGMAIDVEAHMPVLSNIYGGLSGPCIKPVGVRAVYELYREFEKPIIGVGGVVSGRDALEYIMAGASAVQVGTAVLYRGIGVFGEIARELEQWLEEHGYSSISDVVGVAQVR